MDLAINSWPHLLGCSIDKLKVMVKHFAELGISNKKLGQVIAKSPQLLLQKPQKFQQVAHFITKVVILIIIIVSVLDFPFSFPSPFVCSLYCCSQSWPCFISCFFSWIGPQAWYIFSLFFLELNSGSCSCFSFGSLCSWSWYFSRAYPWSFHSWCSLFLVSFVFYFLVFGFSLCIILIFFFLVLPFPFTLVLVLPSFSSKSCFSCFWLWPCLCSFTSGSCLGFVY